MVKFKAKIEIDSRDPDKKGWSYVIIEKKYADKINPGNRRGFRVKGKLDDFPIKQTSLLPVKGGKFLLPINAVFRKGTGKSAGDTLTLSIEVDKKEIALNADLLACLADDPQANTFFKKLSKSHQRYFSRWIDDAKSGDKKIERLTLSIESLSRGKDYPTMRREITRKNKEL